jgi:amidohydrolase
MNRGLDELETFRQSLHREPELSGEERRTAERIATTLEGIPGWKVQRGIGGEGLFAIYDFPKAGPTVVFRAELDAIPVHEDSSKPHASMNSEVSHTCGHDGHMTILVGLAEKIASEPLSCGRAVLLFQPAEETGAGAMAVLANPALMSLKPDAIYALHNVPGYPKGVILCRSGGFSGSVRTLVVQLRGVSTHASHPEGGVNPAGAAAEILLLSERLTSSDDEALQLITPVYGEIGEVAYGTAAGEADLRFTLRTWLASELDHLTAKFKREIQKIAEARSLEFEFSYAEEFIASMNNPDATQRIAEVAKELGFPYEELSLPFRWGEDFGQFTSHIPGAMFGLGAGKETPALHNPRYDFPKEILPTGIEMFYGILKRHGSE